MDSFMYYFMYGATFACITMAVKCFEQAYRLRKSAGIDDWFAIEYLPAGFMVLAALGAYKMTRMDWLWSVSAQ